MCSNLRPQSSRAPPIFPRTERVLAESPATMRESCSPEMKRIWPFCPRPTLNALRATMRYRERNQQATALDVKMHQILNMWFTDKQNMPLSLHLPSACHNHLSIFIWRCVLPAALPRRPSISNFSTEIAAGTFGCGDQKFFRKGMQLTPVGREAGALRPGAAGQGESPVGGSRGGGGTNKRVSL